MGLGPPMCGKCQVLAEYSSAGIHYPDSPHPAKLTHWYCPICNDPNPTAHAGFDKDHHDQLLRNEQFLRFMVNKVIE